MDKCIWCIDLLAQQARVDLLEAIALNRILDQPSPVKTTKVVRRLCGKVAKCSRPSIVALTVYLPSTATLKNRKEQFEVTGKGIRIIGV